MNRRSSYYLFGLLAVAVSLMAMPAMAKVIVLGPPDPGAELKNWWVGASGAGFLSYDDTDPATGLNDFTIGSTNAGRANSVQWRSFIFTLGPAAEPGSPISFSFNYKLMNTVKDGDNLVVQLRFFGKATNFIGQREIYLGSRTGDSEMTSYKKLIIKNMQVPAKAVMADVTCNANADDNSHWSSGAGRFDDFSVITASPFPLLKMGGGAAALLIIVGLTTWFIVYQNKIK